MELLPQADFWQRVGFSAGHILLGFALGVVVSVLLAAAAERWAWAVSYTHLDVYKRQARTLCRGASGRPKRETETKSPIVRERPGLCILLSLIHIYFTGTSWPFSTVNTWCLANMP